MKWEKLREKIEQALDVKVAIEETVEKKGSYTQFLLDNDNHQTIYLTIEKEKLTHAEKKLIELVIDAYRQSQSDSCNTTYRNDGLQSTLHTWLVEQLNKDKLDEPLPTYLSSHEKLREKVVPILLSVDSLEYDETIDIELKKLLETFFEVDLLLIPLLEREWFILAPEDVLQASIEENERGQDYFATKEALESFGLGLYEMISSEWRGGGHLVVDSPIIPAHDLLSSLKRLRETLTIGRLFRTGSHIHFTWQLQFEKLLNSVPEAEKKWFVEQVLSDLHERMDSETILTLEHFFELNCNVSETAKQLYIHRNTLLYRLDKFKQETGFDVRLFSDAVLVKIALVLYKVTKRN